MTQQTIDPRELSLEGSVNFRDIGGLMASDGQRVRSGIVFRSDALHGLTQNDLAILANLRIALLVDLRTREEIDNSGPSPLLSAGARVLHAPLMERTSTDAESAPTMQMDALYAQMLKVARPRIGTIFATLAEEPNLPAVIHCTAGKDRTGVTVALLLRLLGVPDEDIVLDYALTDRNMERLVERLTAAGHVSSQASYPQHYFRAAPETMVSFLRSLDRTHGSAHDYLDSAGVTTTQIESLRTRLLEPAAI